MPPADDTLDVAAASDGATFAVKVVPGAARTRFAGRWQRAVRIAVAAPPEAGRANEALVAFVAEFLAVRRTAVSLVSGHTQARKRLHIAGMSAAQLAAALSGAISAGAPPVNRPTRSGHRKSSRNAR
ncbi:MAG: DUF167 domain-containing protein [Phycisphaerae bacterium]